MKKKFLPFALVPFLLTACAQWPAVENDLVTDVQAGVVAASDAYAAYSAVEQNLTTDNVTTGKLSVAKVLDAATAITQAASTPSLQTAVTDLVTDANATITAMTAKSATPQQTINAVAAKQAATISTVASTPTVAPAPPAASAALPAATTTSLWDGAGAARQAHNLEVEGSSPSPAIPLEGWDDGKEFEL